jgi:hypothetical protein
MSPFDIADMIVVYSVLALAALIVSVLGWRVTH